MNLSVIIPVYNAAAYIGACLNKILSQDISNLEVVIMNSNSTDDTLSIIQNKTAGVSNVKVFSEKDKGIYDAMNKGIEKAKGEWVYFMGADDAFHDNDVLRRLNEFSLDDADILYGDVLWLPGNIKESGAFTYNDLLNRNINHQRIFYRKELFKKYGGYDLKYQVASDHELNNRFFCNDTIRKKYIDLTIADYYAGGFSANKVDEPYWENWSDTVFKNFSKHLPAKTIYANLGNYYRYLINQEKYLKAFKVLLKIVLHNPVPGFIMLLLKYPFSKKS